ncbi:MAG: protein-disulfide reductase DsbD, partial [Paucibacter sp.]|nr:protein-disulfide reductase DsbD [Roseateles sp.]
MNRFLRTALLMAGLALGLAPAARADFLDPAQAFKIAVHVVDAHTVEADWTIAPGYYMYREQFKAGIDGGTLGGPTLGKPKTKFDETFQKTVEIYHDTLKATLPVTAAKGPITLTLTGQGCAEKGLCYPPMTTRWRVDLGLGSVQRLPDDDEAPAPAQTVTAVDQSAASVAATKPSASAVEPAAKPMSASAPVVAVAPVASAPEPAVEAVPTTSVGPLAAANANGGDDKLSAALERGSFWPIVWLCLGLGLGLAFTPCVLPMVPILSSIIVGSGAATSRARGFTLAFGYSLGMAVVYTLLGVAAALAGRGLAAELQNPWVLGGFGVALVLFALSMLGAYELQLPAGLSGRLTETSQKLPGGKLFGVFVMGAVSALIVSPCVTGALATILIHIGKTGDVALGGSALFALAWGMSVPLLITGASAGALLPRAGVWMETIKHVFGLLMLAVALYTVQPILPLAMAQLLWGGLLVGAAAMLGLFEATPAVRPAAWLKKSLAVMALVWGGAQLIGAAQGGTDVLKPLGSFAASGAEAKADRSGEVRFETVHSVTELDAKLAAAGRPVMLDFYADWCVSCKEMDRSTFNDPSIRARLSKALLLRADVTKNSPDDKALLKRFQLFGPPGTIFFDAQGHEHDDTRV